MASLRKASVIKLKYMVTVEVRFDGAENRAEAPKVIAEAQNNAISSRNNRQRAKRWGER